MLNDMGEKINVAELLKDCPKGMELDCMMYENVEPDSWWWANAYEFKCEWHEMKEVTK